MSIFQLHRNRSTDKSVHPTFDSTSMLCAPNDPQKSPANNLAVPRRPEKRSSLGPIGYLPESGQRILEKVNELEQNGNNL